MVNLKNIILTNYDGESNIDYSTWGVIECYWRSLVEYAGDAEMGFKMLHIFFVSYYFWYAVSSDVHIIL